MPVESRLGGGTGRTWEAKGAGPKIAAIFSVVKSCRRLGMPIRQYLAEKLPGLANRSIKSLDLFTPFVHAAATASNLFARCAPCHPCAWSDAYESSLEREPCCELDTYDPRHLNGVSVYRKIGHEFSVGDCTQFTAPDKPFG